MKIQHGTPVFVIAAHLVSAVQLAAVLAVCLGIGVGRSMFCENKI